MTFCHRLKLVAPDGKKRETNCANTEGVFPIIQSKPGKGLRLRAYVGEAYISKGEI